MFVLGGNRATTIKDPVKAMFDMLLNVKQVKQKFMY